VTCLSFLDFNHNQIKKNSNNSKHTFHDNPFLGVALFHSDRHNDANDTKYLFQQQL
jgi:hypothetical protein